MKRSALALIFAMAGCGGAGTKTLPGPAEWNKKVEQPTASDAATQRTACGYKAGDLPQATFGGDTPFGEDIPIDHIVVIMMENRSFDHYFQKLPEAGQPDVEVAPADFSNPVDEQASATQAIYRDTQRCFVDTAHGWNATHREWNDGKMDGFFIANDETHEEPAPMGLDLEMLSGKRAMTYYTQEDLPFAFWAANTFAVADHYHSSLLGPTWPNRMYLYAATSFGRAENTFPEGETTSIFDQLEARSVDWRVYADGLPGFGVLPKPLGRFFSSNVEKVSAFYEAAAAGTLPSVIFVDPGIGNERPAANDEHPPAVMTVGQQWLSKVVDALMKSPNWKSTAIFITYDEHGGLYDHVQPPEACAPDALDPTPFGGGGTPTPGKFDRLGIRVPMMVISPYAKKHYVGHKTYDHTSITKFIEARWILPAMTNRDANAEAPFDMFDFKKPPFKTAPTDMPTVTVDQAAVDACTTLFGAMP